MPATQRNPHQGPQLGIGAAVETFLEMTRGGVRVLTGDLVVEIAVHEPVHAPMTPHEPGTRSEAIGFRRNAGAARRVPVAVNAAGHTEADPGNAAFDRYVIPEVDVLLRVALSLTRNAADAEDLVQETLLRAYRAIDRFDGAHPRAWLLTIMRNAEVNRHRRRRPSLLRDHDASMAQLAAVPSSGAGDPESVVIGETFDAVVSDAFAALPDRHREVVRLVDLDGLSYQEAAEILGVPVGTVMSRLHRARSRMRDRIAAAGLAPRRGER